MAEFGNTCEQLGVPLHILPPRRPQWNGVVERTNRSARAEFWNLYDGPLTVADVSRDLARYEFFFNYERPHAARAQPGAAAAACGEGFGRIRSMVV